MTLQKAWFILRKEGFWAFIYKTIKRSLSLLLGYDVYLVFERRLEEKIIPFPAKRDIRVSILSPDELKNLLRNELDYTEEDLIRARSWLVQGDKCFVGYVNNEISTYLWINLKERKLPGNYRLTLGKSKAFFFKGFTIHSMRGFRLNHALMISALIWLQHNGYSIAYADANRNNRPSTRTLLRTGFQVIGSYRLFRILKWRWVVLAPQLRKTISE